MICKFCGYQNHQGSVYCSGCGRQLESGGGATNPYKNKRIVVGILIVVLLTLITILVCKFSSPNSNNSQVNNQQYMQVPSSKNEKNEYAESNAPTASATQHQHSWMDATCTSPRTCSVCGDTTGSKVGHQWVEATYNKPKTCEKCGATEGSKKSPSAALGLRDVISSAWASSTYAGDNLGTHSPDKMYDGKLNTNWTEDASGSGIGEFVEFYFDDIYAVNKLRIYIGSHYNEDFYKKNCRPKVITLTFRDGSAERIRLEDTYGEQTITFDQYYYTDFIKLTIEDVYMGTKYMDTVIAELDFVVYCQ